MIVGEKSAYWWNTSVIYSDSECRNVMIGKTVRPGYECFKTATLFFSLLKLYTFHDDATPADVWRAAGCAVDCTCECACRADVCRTTTARPATPRRTFIRLRERWRASSGGMCGW